METEGPDQAGRLANQQQPDPRAAWDQPDPCEVFALDGDGWHEATKRYFPTPSAALPRCLMVALENGARSVVVETRYLDRDYRSEYSAFFSKSFASTPDSAHRLHFFGSLIDPHEVWNLPGDTKYLGYIVIRPTLFAPVVRATLVPPPGVRNAVRTQVTETVNFFGQALTVEGVPFTEQDAQLGRCAHAAAWVVHRTAHLRGDVAMRPMADFSSLADASLAPGRPIPSGGLTVLQLTELLRQFDLPTGFFEVGRLPTFDVPWCAPPPEPHHEDAAPGSWDTRIFDIVPWYLDSGFPVIVGTDDHAFVLCGYWRELVEGWGDHGGYRVNFVRHDDQRGPYLICDNALSDFDLGTRYRYGPWVTLLAPMPDKIWLPPEAAALSGGEYLYGLAMQLDEESFPEARAFANGLLSHSVELHTYAATANSYKLALPDRGMDQALTAQYRMARMSRFIWIVEAVDRSADVDKCILGEAIFDATSSEYFPEPLVIHVPGLAAVYRTNGDVEYPIRCSTSGYRTGRIGPP